MRNGVVTATAAALGTFVTPRDDDTWDVDEYISGTDRHAILYQNGRQVGPDTNLSTLPTAPDFTNNYGFRGNMAGSADEIMLADPTDGYVRLFCPNRVVQREADGGVQYPLRGFLSTQDPSSLKYKITKASDNSTVFDWANVGTYSTAVDPKGYTFTGRAARIDTPDADGYVAQVGREDGESGHRIVSNLSPVWLAGDVILWMGQSLMTNGAFATSGGSDAAPANCHFIHGTLGQGGTIVYANPYDRRQLAVLAGSPFAAFEASNTFSTNVPRAHIIGGQGGTFQKERSDLAGAKHQAQLDGIRHAGEDFGSFIKIDGQFEVTGGGVSAESTPSAILANIAAYPAQSIAEIQNAMALTGRPVKGLLCPLTAISGAADIYAELMRKTQWQMCKDNPDIFFWGPMCCDMDSDGTAYHWPVAQHVRQHQRLRWSWDLMMGRTVKDMRGPTLDHVAVNSTTQCTVYVANGSADSVDLINSTAKGDHRGGLRFSTTSDFSALIMPTGHSVGVASGGITPITFTFTAGTLSGGHIYVGGPYGAEPFNPDKLADVRANYSTLASMIVGIYTSPSVVVPIQPYYQVAGGDYISA